MISGSEEEGWIKLPSPPPASPDEFKPSGAFGICQRGLSLPDWDEGEALLPPLEVGCMTSVSANVLYLT